LSPPPRSNTIPAVYWLANAAYLLAGIVYLPIALYHALVLRKNRSGWVQRLGFVPHFQPDCLRIWIHAVSLGEINATPRLVEILREALPGVDFVFSTTTDTGFARAVQLYGQDSVFRFPLDFSFTIRRALKQINPTMIVLVELEVWYNLIRLANRRGVPVAVINGRLTERSFGRLRRLGRLVRPMFRDLAWVGAQDDAIAARFRALGAEDVEVTSSLKWDTAQVADRVGGSETLARALGLNDGAPLWVCGSTGPGEEAIILNAYRLLKATEQLPVEGGLATKDEFIEASRDPSRDRQGAVAAAPHRSATAIRADRGPASAIPPSPRTRLAVVPRKPERFDEVARLIERMGFACVRRSECPDGTTGSPLPAHAVILGDTMGELRKFYSLASVVFVGRSLVPLGGSDPMEAAALAKPIVIGPHTSNFEAPVRALLLADGVRQVDSADALPAAIRGLLANLQVALQVGARARQVVMQNQGATQRTAERLTSLFQIHRRASHAADPIAEETTPAESAA